MAIAIESIVFLIGGILLAVLLWQVLGRPKPASQSAPSVKLVRTPRTVDGREETILTINDRAILTVNNEDMRLSEFADRLEQLEAVATRIAAALNVNVEFTRTAPLTPAAGGVPMDELPLVADADLDELDTRLRGVDRDKGQGAG